MRWIFAILLFVAVAVALIIWLLKSKCKKMEHIVYIHINNDKILPNLGLSFDPQFEVQTEMQPLSAFIGFGGGIFEGFYSFFGDLFGGFIELSYKIITTPRPLFLRLAALE